MLAPMRIPDTKPATELIDGCLVQKISPMYRHQALEKRWVAALDAWADGRGEALTEWRHEFRAPGHSFASLVPDVVYVSFDTLDELGSEGRQKPQRAPEAAVEILSPGQSERNMAWKVDAYIGAGTRVVFVVDPIHRTVIAHAHDGATRFESGDVVTHPAMPGFAYAVDTMFGGRYLED
jgi:Uma2 family endonuclease